MNEQVARNVALVRAIELADTGKEVLSDDDRMYANRSARELAQWQAADSATRPTLEHFLQQRSDQLIKRLSERSAAFASFHKRLQGARLLDLLPIISLLLGFCLDRIADPHRVDLLSAPLLAILAWNVLMYVILLVWLVVPRRTGWLNEVRRRRLAIGGSVPRRLGHGLTAGVTQFVADWTALSEPLIRARVSRTLHLSAMLFAAGAIASLYMRGLMTQYMAGWESTFLDASQVHALLSWLFAPAMLVFGLPGFTEAQVASLHFAQGAPAGFGGQLWVHLYAATLVLFVVLPRLLLAAMAHVRARWLARRFPIDLNQPYFNAFAQQMGVAEPAVVRVLPYSFTLDEGRDKGLAALLERMHGERARIMLRPSSAYGEDPAVALHGADLGDASVTSTVVLFNLAATPEREAHGTFIESLVRSKVRGLKILLDESGFAERIGSQPDGEQRIAERAHLWRQFCDYHGVPSTLVNLAHPDKYPIQ